MHKEHEKNKKNDSLVKLPDGRILNAKLEDIVPDNNEKGKDNKEDFT